MKLTMTFKIIVLALSSLPIWTSAPIAQNSKFRMPNQQTMLELLENNRRCSQYAKSGDNKYIATILANQLVSRADLQETLYGYIPVPDDFDPEIETLTNFLIELNVNNQSSNNHPRRYTSTKMPDYETILALLNSNQPWESPFFLSPNNPKIAAALQNIRFFPTELKKAVYQHMPDPNVTHPAVDAIIEDLIRCANLSEKEKYEEEKNKIYDSRILDDDM